MRFCRTLCTFCFKWYFLHTQIFELFQSRCFNIIWSKLRFKISVQMCSHKSSLKNCLVLIWL